MEWRAREPSPSAFVEGKSPKVYDLHRVLLDCRFLQNAAVQESW